MLGGGRLAVVFDPGDGGFAEETVLVVHQMLVDTGSADRPEREQVHIFSPVYRGQRSGQSGYSVFHMTRISTQIKKNGILLHLRP